ncbi:unnamed protein product [Vitrella brassicaformis CCMP3155]|uniref:Uncharacterized protein n=2 Tax=Vitrella brassicaformis TaxID=1169539 RepID=A0A0G4FFS8_VITBC|nr:unnamed protein product [Vitrella brassicaformis CCMP3155]|eukprot:CEM12037.1 unnamed protein product [Vitrella brassicaformis CCMP3155]
MGNLTSVPCIPIAKDAVPFTAWSVECVEELVGYVADNEEGSFRLTKWRMLSVLGSQHLVDVNNLFTLYEPGCVSGAVNGLSVATGLLLTNRHMSVAERTRRCLAMFDWNNRGGLDAMDLAMLIRTASQAVTALTQGCLHEVTDEQVARWCALAVPDSQLPMPISGLEEWAAENEDICMFFGKLAFSQQDAEAITLASRQAEEDRAAQEAAAAAAIEEEQIQEPPDAHKEGTRLREVQQQPHMAEEGQGIVPADAEGEEVAASHDYLEGMYRIKLDADKLRASLEAANQDEKERHEVESRISAFRDALASMRATLSSHQQALPTLPAETLPTLHTLTSLHAFLLPIMDSALTHDLSSVPNESEGGHQGVSVAVGHVVGVAREMRVLRCVCAAAKKAYGKVQSAIYDASALKSAEDALGSFLTSHPPHTEVVDEGSRDDTDSDVRGALSSRLTRLHTLKMRTLQQLYLLTTHHESPREELKRSLCRVQCAIDQCAHLMKDDQGLNPDKKQAVSRTHSEAQTLQQKTQNKMSSLCDIVGALGDYFDEEDEIWSDPDPDSVTIRLKQRLADIRKQEECFRSLLPEIVSSESDPQMVHEELKRKYDDLCARRVTADIHSHIHEHDAKALHTYLTACEGAVLATEALSAVTSSLAASSPLDVEMARLDAAQWIDTPAISEMATLHETPDYRGFSAVPFSSAFPRRVLEVARSLWREVEQHGRGCTWIQQQSTPSPSPPVPPPPPAEATPEDTDGTEQQQPQQAADESVQQDEEGAAQPPQGPQAHEEGEIEGGGEEEPVHDEPAAEVEPPVHEPVDVGEMDMARVFEEMTRRLMLTAVDDTEATHDGNEMPFKSAWRLSCRAVMEQLCADTPDAATILNTLEDDTQADDTQQGVVDSITNRAAEARGKATLRAAVQHIIGDAATFQQGMSSIEKFVEDFYLLSLRFTPTAPIHPYLSATHSNADGIVGTPSGVSGENGGAVDMVKDPAVSLAKCAGMYAGVECVRECHGKDVADVPTRRRLRDMQSEYMCIMRVMEHHLTTTEIAFVTNTAKHNTGDAKTINTETICSIVEQLESIIEQLFAPDTHHLISALSADTAIAEHDGGWARVISAVAGGMAVEGEKGGGENNNNTGDTDVTLGKVITDETSIQSMADGLPSSRGTVADFSLWYMRTLAHSRGIDDSQVMAANDALAKHASATRIWVASHIRADVLGEILRRNANTETIRRAAMKRASLRWLDRFANTQIFEATRWSIAEYRCAAVDTQLTFIQPLSALTFNEIEQDELSRREQVLTDELESLTKKAGDLTDPNGHRQRAYRSEEEDGLREGVALWQSLKFPYDGCPVDVLAMQLRGWQPIDTRDRPLQQHMIGIPTAVMLTDNMRKMAEVCGGLSAVRWLKTALLPPAAQDTAP